MVGARTSARVIASRGTASPCRRLASRGKRRKTYPSIYRERLDRRPSARLLSALARSSTSARSAGGNKRKLVANPRSCSFRLRSLLSRANAQLWVLPTRLLGLVGVVCYVLTKSGVLAFSQANCRRDETKGGVAAFLRAVSLASGADPRGALRNYEAIGGHAFPIAPAFS